MELDQKEYPEPSADQDDKHGEPVPAVAGLTITSHSPRS